ncbi:MAG: Rha family transcriptional regulator [Bacteroidetes bacterium]|nr:Rha family transcriptional regulator [Bacteroidota bacterium]
MKELVYENGNGQPVTDSLRVAMKFKKRHDHVLDAIREIIAKAQKSGFVKKQAVSEMFVLTEQEIEMPVGGGYKKSPVFIMSESGFSLLAMGFSGQKAFEFKTDFLFEFQKRGKIINELLNNQIYRAQESARIRFLKSSRKREIDASIKSLMKERDMLVKEINQIDRSDFMQLNIYFSNDNLNISLGFPHKRIA